MRKQPRATYEREMAVEFLLAAAEALFEGGVAEVSAHLRPLHDYLIEQEHPEHAAVGDVLDTPYRPPPGRLRRRWPLLSGGWWYIRYVPPTPGGGDSYATLELVVHESASRGKAVRNALGRCRQEVECSNGRPEPTSTRAAVEFLRLWLIAARLGVSSLELATRWQLRNGSDFDVAVCLLLPRVPRDALEKLRRDQPERYRRALVERQRLPEEMHRDEHRSLPWFVLWRWREQFWLGPDD